MPALLPALALLAAPMTVPPSSTADSTQTYYAQKNVRALRGLLDGADTRAARLLCRYRLYPLTEDERYLRNLPDELDADATARERALLSGLWGYRAARASVFGAVRYGRRAMRLLKQARAQDPDDPFVLLVQGQSLLFRPAIAGGDDEAALQRFRRLRTLLADQPGTGVSRAEADLWTWYALRELERAQAPVLRRRLAARALPPLYREFLRHPPG